MFYGSKFLVCFIELSQSEKVGNVFFSPLKQKAYYQTAISFKS